MTNTDEQRQEPGLSPGLSGACGDQSASATDASPVICIAGLRHWYGDREALAGIDVQIDAGEMFGLLGPNGGGKTTLFRLLATLVPPMAGQVRIFTHDLPRAAAMVRAHLEVERHRSTLSAAYHVMASLVRASGRRVRLWEPPDEN